MTPQLRCCYHLPIKTEQREERNAEGGTSVCQSHRENRRERGEGGSLTCQSNRFNERGGVSDAAHLGVHCKVVVATVCIIIIIHYLLINIKYRPHYSNIKYHKT